ncbi:MAG: AraC family ligand binding domain-containing protein [Syntrophorhabdaceae bacterium]
MKRDYGAHDAIKTVTPAIFTPDESSWVKIDDTSRRKVFFNDRLTLELFEWSKSGLTGNITTNHRFNDTVGYILAGSAMVTVGKDTRQISAGGVFLVPSNTPYGVIPAAEKTSVLYAYTPPREDLRPNAPRARRFPDNEIKSIVYKWFALFDEKARAGDFLTYLAETGLVIEMPDKTKLNSWHSFQDWYASWLLATESFSSTIQSVTTSFDPTAGRYLADVLFSSVKKTRSTKALPGKTLTGHYQVHMELVDTNWGDSPKIVIYKETEAKK